MQPTICNLEFITCRGSLLVTALECWLESRGTEIRSQWPHFDGAEAVYLNWDARWTPGGRNLPSSPWQRPSRSSVFYVKPLSLFSLPEFLQHGLFNATMVKLALECSNSRDLCQLGPRVSEFHLSYISRAVSAPGMVFVFCYFWAMKNSGMKDVLPPVEPTGTRDWPGVYKVRWPHFIAPSSFFLFSFCHFRNHRWQSTSLAGAHLRRLAASLNGHHLSVSSEMQ